MPSCKLILTDIDGTIVPYGKGTASDRALAAIHAAQAAGIRFGPCTGRAQTWIAPLFQGDEAACATCVASNGIEVFLDGRPLRQEAFDPDALEGLVSYVGTHMEHSGVLAFSDRTPYLLSGTRDDLRGSFDRYADDAVEVDGVPRDKRLNKANVFLPGDLDATRKAAADLNAHVAGLDFDVPEPAFLNVMPAGISKATGIDVLCDALGISPDEVVAFGDGGNDVAMLTHVGNGVAVGDAQREAAEAARWHIGPCAEDSVAAAIERLAAGEWPFES